MKTAFVVIAGFTLLLTSYVHAQDSQDSQSETVVIRDAIEAAAHAHDPKEIRRLILKSHEVRGSFDEATGTLLLNELAQDTDFAAFRSLLGELRSTNYGKDWQPSDVILDEWIAKGGEEFINLALSEWLDLDRLASRARIGKGDAADWAAQRAVEVRQQRADEEDLVGATARGDLVEMRRLLDSGVNVNCIAESRHTPLTTAAGKDQLEAAKLLLDRGAAVDQPKHPGWDYTPLCLAKSVGMAELLKARGADVHAKLFKRDVSILTYVARFNGAHMVQWFLAQGLDPKMVGDNNQNLLFESRDADTTRVLLEAGLNPNWEDESGDTPIIEAPDAESVRLLVKHGAKVTGLKNAILPRIIYRGGHATLEAFIEVGAEVTPGQLEQALQAAAHTDKPEAVRALIKLGVDPNKKLPWDAAGEHKQEPLMTCCVFGATESAKVLLELGANPNGSDKSGGYLRTAISNGYADLAKLLKDAGAQGVEPLEFAIATADTGKVSELLATAPTYQEEAPFWAGTLTTAARLGDLGVIKAALGKGVPVAPVEGSESPLQAAASEGQHEALELLLASWKPSGAPVSDLRPALWIAVLNSNPYNEQRSVEDFEKTVRLLLDAGAPLVTADEKLENVIVAAVYTRHPGGNANVLEMLVAAGANPNPMMDPEKKLRLTDQLIQFSDPSNCFIPSASTLAALERVTNVKLTR